MEHLTHRATDEIWGLIKTPNKTYDFEGGKISLSEIKGKNILDFGQDECGKEANLFIIRNKKEFILNDLKSIQNYFN